MALLRNCLNEMFTMTEVSKVSDAVNISRRLLRSNPKKWYASFPPIFLFNQITPNSAYLLLNAGHFALKNLKLYLLDKSVRSQRTNYIPLFIKADNQPCF